MPLISSDLDGGGAQEKRRVALFSITAAALQTLFTTGSRRSFRVIEGVPEGAKLVGGEWSPSAAALLLYFEHESFDAVWETLPSIYEYPLRIEVRSD